MVAFLCSELIIIVFQIRRPSGSEIGVGGSFFQKIPPSSSGDCFPISEEISSDTIIIFVQIYGEKRKVRLK